MRLSENPMWNSCDAGSVLKDSSLPYIYLLSGFDLCENNGKLVGHQDPFLNESPVGSGLAFDGRRSWDIKGPCDQSWLLFVLLWLLSIKEVLKLFFKKEKPAETPIFQLGGKMWGVLGWAMEQRCRNAEPSCDLARPAARLDWSAGSVPPCLSGSKYSQNVDVLGMCPLAHSGLFFCSLWSLTSRGCAGTLIW